MSGKIQASSRYFIFRIKSTPGHRPCEGQISSLSDEISREFQRPHNGTTLRFFPNRGLIVKSRGIHDSIRLKFPTPL